ncbi:MAG: hypothetical protein ACK4S0_08510 [Sediminibacterium sp.]
MHILFFDYWDKGLPVLKNSLSFFKNESVEKRSMVHLDSFFRKDFIPYQHVEGIDIYDISYFEGKNLSEIIDQLKPTDILITNLKLYERIISMIANRKKIPVYYFLHGNIGPIFAELSPRVKKIGSLFSKVSSIIRNLGLVNKYFKIYKKFYYPEYVKYNIFGTAFSRKRKFLAFLLNKVKNRFYDFEYIEFADDYFVDYCVVYSKKDVEFLNSTKVHICKYYIRGNLELVNNINEFRNKWSSKKQILIVDDGFTAYNLYGLTPDKMKSIVNQVILAFSQHPVYAVYEVVLKIKPQELTNFESMGINCRIVRNDPIYKCIQESELIIGTHSTALQYAIIDHKPLLLMKWAEYATVPDVYLQHGIGNQWTDKNQIPEIKINVEAYDKYIADYNLDGKINISVNNTW